MMRSTENQLAGQKPKRWSSKIHSKIPPLTVVLCLLSNIYLIRHSSLWDKAPERSTPTMPHVLEDNSGDAPTFIRQAISWCKTAGLSQNKDPTLFTRLVTKRNWRWKKMLKEKKQSEIVDFYNVLNHKLGAYMYAAKVGVQSPRVLFCGKAEDLPPDMSSAFGRKYVAKPLRGHSSKGVNIVVDGVDKFTGKEVGRVTLVKEFGRDGETIVEELIESADPYFKDEVPPDYKFHVYEGRPEVLWVIDRNNNHRVKCNNNFDVSSDDWRPLELASLYPWCPPDRNGKVNEHYLDPTRKVAMMNAVRALAGKLGGDWMRIDMFDSKDRGPVIGEFTPHSGLGHSRDPVDSCIMSHLIVAHAEHGKATDDIKTLRAVGNGMGINLDFLPESAKSPDWNRLGLTLEEVRQWGRYNELERCEATMRAQQGLNDQGS